ncbi:MAG: efflux RND transporter permease subunit [Gammaproteobacteria bacterium]|nr:efflux RND transporter permease subunit [Gammaproteobacteria bacterium]
MNLAEFSIKNKVLSVIVILLATMGGWSAYQSMPRFEDPEFTIRTAQVYTQYPGASPEEVANEVTDPLETAIQQMQEVDSIRSVSSDGVSEISVDIKYEFSRTRSDLQIIWTKLRSRVSDAERSLPPGAATPIVNDDFGDVYGFYYLLTGDGYTPAELRRYAEDLQTELLQVEGVAKVSLAGELNEAIYVEISRQNAAALGVSVSNIYDTISQQNSSVAAGNVTIGDQRVIIDPSGAIDSVEAISNLLVSVSSDGRLTYLSDLARVYRGYQTPPAKLIRLNGEPAIALGISNVTGANVVQMGSAIDARLAESESRRPIGMVLHEYYHQGNIVDASIQNFAINVVAALVIVIVTLLLFMGARSGLVMGAILLITVFATLATMSLVGIPMHRISLGALIIALGMMVDNAIVVTEGILVGVQRGKRKIAVAIEVVDQTKWPLLGGTLVGIIAFAPIGFAPGSTAEYTGHLFWVVLISLMFSWIFALTLTPLFCFWLFKETSEDSPVHEEGRFTIFFKRFMDSVLRVRWAAVAGVLALFATALWGFQFVKSGFFPASTTPQVVVDYWLPQGTDIERTSSDMTEIEAFMQDLEGVEVVQTLVGGGALRYMLIYSFESQNSAYGQILARVDDYRRLDTIMPEIRGFLDENFPDGQGKVWRFVLGPGGGSKIEATFQGPDPQVLRGLANEAKRIMIEDGGALSIKDDWRQPVSIVEPIYSADRGRLAGVSREDLATALQTNFNGVTVGVYREGNNLLPIISRAPAAERSTVSEIQNVQILSSTTGRVVPVAQVTEGFRTIWRDALLRREDRVWTIKAQSDPYPDELAADLLSRLRPKIEAIELPDGYSIEWDGEYGDSQESNSDLASTIPYGLLAMVLVVFVLFGSVRQPVVIWLVVPLAIIGVVPGLIVTQTPMEFMGILGVLSLSGLLIKNAIVLVDQMNVEITSGKPRYDAVIDSAASRVRPVMMGTLTTILGVIPLFFDAFFKSMAVVIVFGLSFATLLTLIIVPVLYTLFFRITSRETSHAVA